jgi:hypothetical protein
MTLTGVSIGFATAAGVVSAAFGLVAAGAAPPRLLTTGLASDAGAGF